MLRYDDIMNDIQTSVDQEQAQIDREHLNSAYEVLMYSLSDSSERQYRHTFNKWMEWCEHHGAPIWEMSAQNLIHFLESEPLSHNTKSARLSHLRKFLQTLHAQAPGNMAIKAMYEQAKLLKVKRSDDEKTQSRNKVALDPEQVHRALNVWNTKTLLHKRNKALLAVLFYSGLRRSEAVVLRWSDIDLEQELVHVRHGKGDKSRTIPLLGGTTARRILEDWEIACLGREFVFCGVRKGGYFAADKPMGTNTAWRVVQATGHAIGVDFAPHDARRTLLTNGLAAGSSVADMQFIAGHANPQTTLGYAVVKDAKEVKGRVKLNY